MKAAATGCCPSRPRMTTEAALRIERRPTRFAGRLPTLLGFFRSPEQSSDPPSSASGRASGPARRAPALAADPAPPDHARRDLPPPRLLPRLTPNLACDFAGYPPSSPRLPASHTPGLPPHLPGRPLASCHLKSSPVVLASLSRLLRGERSCLSAPAT